MSGLSQEDFRRLLATPRAVLANQSKKEKAPKPKEKEKVPKKEKAEAADDDVFAKPEIPKKKKKENMEEDSNNTGVSYEQSKFLGGDVDHTHLVKGLDFALLEKVKTDMGTKDANDAGNDSSEMDATSYLESLHGDESKPKFTIKLAEDIYKIAVTKEALRKLPKKIETFAEGRSAFSFDLTPSGSDKPTLILRSRMEFKEEKKSSADDAMVINGIIRLLEHRRIHGAPIQAAPPAKKVTEEPAVKPDQNDMAIDKPAAPPLEDDDADIFSDVGADYKLDVKRPLSSSNAAKADWDDSDDSDDSDEDPLPLPTKTIPKSMMPLNEPDGEEDYKKQPLDVKALIASSESMLTTSGSKAVQPRTSAVSRLRKLQGGYGEDGIEMNMELDYQSEEEEENEEKERRRLKEMIMEEKNSLAWLTRDRPQGKYLGKKDKGRRGEGAKPGDADPQATPVKKPAKNPNQVVKAKLNRELEQVDKVMMEKFGKSVLKKRPTEDSGEPNKRPARSDD
ncbi:hypothetical protein HDU96_009262 [Phlyctochytrium bullatum]|nr:hypothetical protein HDU96_009262 [Phlyctochytrium bullatum]